MRVMLVILVAETKLRFSQLFACEGVVFTKVYLGVHGANLQARVEGQTSCADSIALIVDACVMRDQQCAVVQKCKTFLLKHLKPVNVFADELLSENVFSRVQLDAIERESSPVDQKQRLLNELMTSQNDDAFSGFLRALDLTGQRRSAEVLRSTERKLQAAVSLTAGDQPPPFPIPASDDSQYRTESLSHDSVDTVPVETFPVPATSGHDRSASLDLRVQRNRSSAGHLFENIYDMESCTYRGHALIINNYEFESDDLKNREGWQSDSDNLRDLFQFLEFEQLELCNLNAQGMKKAIARFAQDEKSLNASSLAVVIMTHGNETSFFGVDGHKVHPYTDILLNFHRDYAPGLIEKPKLFIFQACRGHRQDLAQEVFDPQDEPEDGPSVTGATGGQPVPRKTVPLPNMLIVNATVPGYVAWRNIDDGSWLIKDFCRIVRSKAHEDHLLDIITEVSRQLNNRNFKAIQQIHPEHLLTHKWFLFPPRL
ncbi:hypothetical protein CAPTEDRAFT_209613 [Capitella teleta]|uniref:Caspase-2 n=1 Tax=Capitella teleta TaxID=283909 RepID=R7T9Y1_CAPTE|nr:hypothetical protein CAPTEDRAFT_209613 [Capitella teleta]|eukprot:ELT90563.1 hypothetical protein CAPTEDRAFT_209613 [Capitella teleta]